MPDFSICKATKYIEISKSNKLIRAIAVPYFKIAKEPENPISDSNRGLQKGQVTLKKLRNAPKNPTFADFRDFCLDFIA